MSLFFIAQEMLESQICLWCIFVNNLLDKVSWLLELFGTINIQTVYGFEYGLHMCREVKERRGTWMDTPSLGWSLMRRWGLDVCNPLNEFWVAPIPPPPRLTEQLIWATLYWT